MSPTVTNPRVQCFKNHEELAEAAVIKMLALSQRTIREKGRFALALSNGLTIRFIASLMANASYRNEFDWEHIHFFWADEKWVPPTDSRSHYALLAESLLTRVDIPIENIHPIRTNLPSPLDSARRYQEDLRNFFELEDDAFPSFDLVCLGVGRGGEVAALFPDDLALEVREQKVVVAVPKDTLEFRVTLTLPVLNHVQNIFFIASGKEKALIVKQVFEGGEDSMLLPVRRVRPLNGSSQWFLDKAAASLLSFARF